jgi:hypothetical protein
MKENFLQFITALNDLKDPVKHLESFTHIARELKVKPDASIGIVSVLKGNLKINQLQTKPSTSSSEKMSAAKTTQKSIDPALGELTPDLESVGQTFEGQKDLLALFRVLGNVITKLPTNRRHSHLQGLLNISSAALNAPVQISWQSEVFQSVEKRWSIANNTVSFNLIRFVENNFN